MGSVNVLQTGKSGLFTARSGLSTTGHNIANVNTEGFSRQRVEQTTAPSSQYGNLVFGTGVKQQNVIRVNDEYLTRQIANEAKFMGQYEEKDLALAQTENIFNEISNEGMNRLIAKFFNEFRKLGNEPESLALRTTVRENADQLIGDFKRISRSLKDAQKNIDNRISATVGSVNDLAHNIANLNSEIKKFEMQGGFANDLRDKRDLAVKKLSNLVDIGIATNEKNDLTISIRNAGPLVTGQFFNKMEVRSTKKNNETGTPEGSYEVHLVGLAESNITQKLTNGRLSGLVESRDRLIGEAQRRIDELAYTMSKKINEIHIQGFNLNGTSGVNFFKNLNTMDDAAEMIGLSNAVKDDANNIATALEPDSPGDNRLMQMIARIQHQRVMSNGTATFDDHYNSTVADLASVTQKTKQSLEHQTNIVGQLEKLRESISGVSLDEETTNLVQYQHAFDASAKVIQTANEMLDTVLNLKRF